MKPAKPIARVSQKLKRGVPMIYNGQTVYIELEKSFGNVLVCDNEERRLEDAYFEVKRSELEPMNKARTGIQSKPKTLTKSEKVSKDGLNEFFDRMSLKMPFNCMNCMKPLYAHNKFAKRTVCAHIIEKSKFPSVADLESNILFLGADLLGICDCHDRWDSNIETRIKMKVYPLALKRFELFKHFLTDKELQKAGKYLNIAI